MGLFPENVEGLPRAILLLRAFIKSVFLNGYFSEAKLKLKVKLKRSGKSKTKSYVINDNWKEKLFVEHKLKGRTTYQQRFENVREKFVWDFLNTSS